jgi:RimJ/RimL family protein N-acetyltransferase
MRAFGIKPRIRVVASHRIDTDRLLLRSPRLDDANEISRLLGNRNVAHWLVRVPYPYRPEHARAWIQRSGDERAAGIGWPFVIFSRDGRSMVGSMDLSIEDDHASASLGYWLGEPFWGFGYASEAAQAVLGFAFDVLKLREVTANALVDNFRSIRVLQKAGLRYVEDRPEDTVERGRVDTAFFAVDSASWNGGTAWTGGAAFWPAGTNRTRRE